MEIKRCKICGNIVPAGMRTLCSEECRQQSKRLNSCRHQRKIRSENRMVLGMKICTVCGKEFSPKNSRQVRCSRTCTKEGRTDYKRKYRMTKKQMAEEQKRRDTKANPIVKFGVQAGKAGTSYGKYESQFYLAKQSEEMAKRRRELDAEWERKRKNGNQ